MSNNLDTQNYIYDKESLHKSVPDIITLEETEKIIDQMKYCICKIYSPKGAGTGFFTKIPFNKGDLHVLITNYHVLTKDDILNKNISYYLGNNKNNKKDIFIDEHRKIFECEKLDIIIIEIKDKDNIKNNYLELDLKEHKYLYSEKTIYILGYPVSKENISVSYGLLKNVTDEDQKLRHLSNTEGGSSGSPILLLNSGQVIAVHTEGSKTHNLGSFIIDIIKKFNEEYHLNNNQTNENEKIKEKNDKLNNLNIIYKIKNKKEKLKLFGKEFFDKNKDKCNMIINDKEREISEIINIDEIIKNNDKGKEIEIEVTLKETKKINNYSHLFEGCSSLYSLKEDSNFDTSNVTNIRKFFSNCSSLSNISIISKWKTHEIKDMSYIFQNCSSLIKLPDISKWNTSSVESMHGMFSGCKNLEELPDISNWNTGNVNDMTNMFSECSSINKLPDISKWDTKNVQYMNGMFYKCSELSKFPDESQWETGKVKEMNGMFAACSKLINLNNIYKWNTENVTDMKGIFSGCTLLNNIDKIYKWDTKNVNDMSEMFRNCQSLEELPDIYKWDTQNVTNMSSMFSGCSKLSSLPNINKWNTKKVTNFNNMFYDCNKLKGIPSKYQENCLIY